MVKRNALRDAIVLALAAGLAGVGTAAAQTAGQAQAAEAGQEDEATGEKRTTLESVTVTGSRISVPGLTSNSPITTITREEIDATQPVTAEEFVRTSPGVTTPIGPGVNNGSGGGATMSMRDIGSNRSLVLIDGRRMVPFTLGGTVDINTIPVALIESVDFLTGGASAVYGADAIGGVTNFILRRDFTGVEVSTSWGMSWKDYDQRRFRWDATGGANFADGRGNVALSVGRTNTDPLFQGDRDIGAVSVNSRTGNPEGSASSVPAVFLLSGRPGVPSVGQIDPATGSIVPYYASYNFNPLNYYYTPMDRDQATFLGRFEVNEHAELYTQAFYTKSTVGLSLAPSALFLNTFQVPIGNPYIPEPARQQLCTAYGIADCTEGNPQLIPLTIGRRLTELGPRLNDYIGDTRQYNVGVRGDITDNWRYDAYYSHGESVQDSERINWGSLSKTRQALNAVSTDACVDPSNGCVPLNVFGAEGTVTQAMLDFINLGSVSTTTVEQDIYAAFVSGDLGDIKLPWAAYPIGVAVGVERREQSAKTRADAQSQITGEVMGTGAPFPDRQGGIQLDEVYAEAIVPLLDGKPFAEELSFEAGYRKSDFETSVGTGTDYDTWKGGLKWAPITGLTFRGTLQQAVRAPSISELFAPQVTGLANLAVDPCAGTATNQAEANTPGTLSNLCRQTGVPAASLGALPQPSAGQINVLSGGDTTLGPEQARTRTVGFVWEPSFVQDFSVTFDYWKIGMEEMISSQAVGDVLNGCYNRQYNPNLAMNADCGKVGRSTVNGTFNGVESRGVVLTLSNLGRLTTDGYDLRVNYRFGLGEAGRLGLRLDATKVKSWEFQATPQSINRDCLGFYSTDCGVGPYELKANLTANWEYKAFDTMLRVRHLSEMQEEPLGTPFLPAYATIPAYEYVDLGVAYQTPFGLRLNFTVNNLLDKEAPFVGNTIGTTSTNSGNTFPQSYDVIGRYWTLGMNYKF